MKNAEFKTSEARRRAVAKYDSKNTKFYGLKFNIKTDADIIHALDSVSNKQQFVKEAIRSYLAQEKK